MKIRVVFGGVVLVMGLLLGLGQLSTASAQGMKQQVFADIGLAVSVPVHMKEWDMDGGLNEATPYAFISPRQDEVILIHYNPKTEYGYDNMDDLGTWFLDNQFKPIATGYKRGEPTLGEMDGRKAVYCDAEGEYLNQKMRRLNMGVETKDAYFVVTVMMSEEKHTRNRPYYMRVFQSVRLRD